MDYAKVVKVVKMKYMSRNEEYVNFRMGGRPYFALSQGPKWEAAPIRFATELDCWLYFFRFRSPLPCRAAYLPGRQAARV